MKVIIIGGVAGGATAAAAVEQRGIFPGQRGLHLWVSGSPAVFEKRLSITQKCMCIFPGSGTAHALFVTILRQDVSR